MQLLLPPRASLRSSTIVPKLSQFAGQILVAVVATGLASALFGARAPAPTETAQAGKYANRIADAAMPARTMALYPQDIAALSAIERFKPVAFTPAPVEAKPAPAVAIAAPRPTRVETANVLPPPRPKDAPVVVAAVVPAPAAVETSVEAARPRGLVIAGLAIPTPHIDLPKVDLPKVGLPDIDVKKYIPTGDDVAKTVGHARSAVDWLAHVATR